MKGRAEADPASYFPAMEGLGVASNKHDGSSSSLRRRIGSMLRSSALGSVCSLTASNVSDVVQEPIFVSSRRLGNLDLRRLERAPSLPSSSASTTISSGINAVKSEPCGRFLGPQHRRSHSAGSVRPKDSGGALGCRTSRHRFDLAHAGRSDYRAGESKGNERAPAHPMTPPVGRHLKFSNRRQLSYAPVEVSRNGFINDKMKKGPPSFAAATGLTTKKKGKTLGGFLVSTNPYGFTSSSSSESDAGGGGSGDILFSTDEEEEYGKQGGVLRRHWRDDETETLFSSSRSFSSDSTAGMAYYYRSSRRNRSSRRTEKSQQKKHKLLPNEAASTSREEPGVVNVGSSMRINFDDVSDRHLMMPVPSSISMAAEATAACSSSTTTSATRGSGTDTARMSTDSPLPDNEELLEQVDHVDVEEGSSTQAQQGPRQKKQETTVASHNDGLAEDLTKETEDGGYAVVKESFDPYSDFLSSAMEMIIERQLFGAREMKRLLYAFLSLNNPSHHGVILQVFDEIGRVLFD